MQQDKACIEHRPRCLIICTPELVLPRNNILSCFDISSHCPPHSLFDHRHFYADQPITDLTTLLSQYCLMAPLIKRLFHWFTYINEPFNFQPVHLTWVGSIVADNDSLQFTQRHCFDREVVRLKKCCTFSFPSFLKVECWSFIKKRTTKPQNT